jgi:hypothetical protein
MSGDTSGATNLRDTLPVLSAEEHCPCDPAGVFALEEKGLRLSVLEAEDLAVTADVELALIHHQHMFQFPISALSRRVSCPVFAQVGFDFVDGEARPETAEQTHLARVDFGTAEGVVVGTHGDGVGAVPVVSLGGRFGAVGIFGVSASLCVSENVLADLALGVAQRAAPHRLLLVVFISNRRLASSCHIGTCDVI